MWHGKTQSLIVFVLLNHLRLWLDWSVYFQQFLAVEPQSYANLIQALIAIAQAILVIPPVVIERIVDQWGAHDEKNLSAAQAKFKFIQHLIRYHIALLDIYLINPREPNVPTAGKYRGSK